MLGSLMMTFQFALLAMSGLAGMFAALFHGERRRRREVEALARRLVYHAEGANRLIHELTDDVDEDDEETEVELIAEAREVLCIPRRQ